MNEMQTYQPGAAAVARTPEALGAEVRNLTNAAKYLTVYYAVEIGRRLTEAKELVAHGEWMDWLKSETEFSQSGANRLMRIYTEYGQKMGLGIAPGANSSTLINLSVSNALRLLAVPEEEREGFAAEVDAEHISARELEEAIRERDEAKKALQEAREGEEQRRAEVVAPYEERIRELERAVEDAGPYEERIRKAEARVKELEGRPIEVAVQEPDPAEIERRVAEATEAARADKEAAERLMAEEKEKAKAAVDKLKEKLKAAEEKLAGAGAEDKAAAEAAQAEVAALKKQLAMSGDAMVTFKLRFADWQEAYAAMRRALGELDEEKAAKGKQAIRAVLEKWGAA